MATQNRFKTGLDIARYTAAIMRKDMAAYDADTQLAWFCCATKYDRC
jgi:isocitrate lyase